MHIYSVTVKPNSDTLQFLNQADPDAVVEFVDTLGDGTEIYDISTIRDIDALLDQQPGIISYEIRDEDTPQYAAHSGPDSAAQILEVVIANGRILGNDDGTFQTASLEIEIEFEAGERGLGSAAQADAVAFAMAHAKHR